MSTEAKEKDEKEPFDYSWYLPVSGRKTPAGEQPPEQPTVQELEPKNEKMVESAQTVPESAPKQMAGSSGPRKAFGFHLNVSPSLLRIAGLSVWSIISAVGMIILLVTQTPVRTTQVLALGGVWAAVSALIWLLPSRLTN